MADQLRELVIKVTIEADEKPLEQVGEASEEATTKAVALGTVLGGLATKLVDVAVEAAKAGAAMLKDLVFGTAEAADEIAKTSQKLGVASDQLQRLRGAAELSGASMGDLDSGLRDLQKNLGEAVQKGAGPAVEALGALGLEVAEVDSLLAEGDVEGALGLIGDAANDLADPVQKQAVLLKLLGGAGGQLGPLLAAGTEGIGDLGDRISATGEVISADALPAFEAMQDNLRDIEGRVEGAKRTIASALAPTVSDIADRFETWIDSNRDFIEQDLPRILETVAEAAIELAEFTFELLESWREFSRDASDLAEILTSDVDPALGGVGGTLSGMTDIASGLGLALADITVQFLEAVGAGEELVQVFKEIREGITGDDRGTRGTRGAGAQLRKGGLTESGGRRTTTVANSLDPRFEQQAIATLDTAKLRKIASDPGFSDTARARATAVADKIDVGVARQAEEEAAFEAAKRTVAVRQSRDRARTAQRTQRRATGGGGGGGGAAQPTVEDLIGATAAGAAPTALRSAASALRGTLLNTIDNRIQITVEAGAVDVGGVRVTADLPANVGPEAASAIASVVRGELSEQIREVTEIAQQRRSVGP